MRHGQSEWNAQGRWQGQADPPLTELGREQARLAAHRLEDIDAVVASDLQRAAQTASIVAAHLQLPVAHTDHRLRERHAGPWQGLTHADIERIWPGWIKSDQRPEGYEADHLVADRALEALWELAHTFAGHTVVGVSHSGTIRAVVDRVNGRGTRLANLAGVWLHLEAGQIAVIDEIHLLGDETATHVE